MKATKQKTDMLSARSYIVLLLFLFAASSSAGSGRSVFALADINKTVPDWMWASNWIAGAALRGHWQTYELQKGEYNWSIIDSEIAKAAASGKVVTLRVLGGARGTPDWVYKAGAQTYEWTVGLNPWAIGQNTTFKKGQILKAPIPWDPVWLQEWKLFIQAMGKKFSPDPHVVVIIMTCGVGPWGEMILPRSSEMKVGWRELGWDDDKYFTAYKACIDAYADAFPEKRLAMSFSRPGDAPASVALRILRYAREALGERFMAMQNGFSGAADYNKYEIDSGQFNQRLIATICKDGKAGKPIGFQQLANRTVRFKQKLSPGHYAFAGPERMGRRFRRSQT